MHTGNTKFLQKQTRPGNQAIPNIHISCEAVPKALRYKYWRELLSPLVVLVPDPAVPLADFYQEVEAYNLESLLVMKETISARYYQKTQHEVLTRKMQAFVAMVYLSGGMEGKNGDQFIHAEAGDIVLLDTSRDLELHVRESRILSVIITRELMYHHTRGQEVAAGLVLKSGTSVTTVLYQQLLHIWEELSMAKNANIDTINGVLLGSITGAFSTSNMLRLIERSHPQMDLSSVCTYIDAHLQEDLSVLHLCEHFDCSRSKIYRLFSPMGGMANYIRRLRLRHCLEDLTNPYSTYTKVAEVGLKWGFASHSHFCRLFRQEFGLTPGEVASWRRLARCENDDMAAEDLSLFLWLENMLE